MPEFAQQEQHKQRGHLVSALNRGTPQARGLDAQHLTSENLGNQAAQRFAQSCPLHLPSPGVCPFGGVCHACPARVQAKLRIGRPSDEYGQEADRVAEEVMWAPVSSVAKRAMITRLAQSPRLQRECSGCDEELHLQPMEEEEEEEKVLQSKKVPGQTPIVTPSVQAQIGRMRGGGKPLPESVRAFFEPRFGCDFGQVRVHTDSRAVETARAMNARALTVGHDIIFWKGQYSAGTLAGRRLLAHELTHVVQQTKMAPGRLMVQFQRFRDCTPGITGAAMTQDQIDNLLLGSRMAAELVSLIAEVAVRHIRDGTGTVTEAAAFAANFGAPTPTQTNTILNRFATISRRLGNDRLFICNTARSAYCRRGWCAYTTCPESGGYTHLCPPTFQTPLPCAEPDVDRMMVHEAVHAAGACNDVYPGAGYPPANAHNNAPSYAGFAYAVF